MARGTLLSTIRTYLKAELRDAQETNTTLDAEYNYAIANKQKDLAFAYDWNFLKHDWDLSCTAGGRYFDIPTVDSRAQSVTINFERPVLVARLFNSFYNPISYGITTEDYNLFEGTSEPQDPIQKWQVVTNTNEASNPDEIEVWPVPASTQVLRFTGQRNLQALTSDSHTADLDDMLLVYMVAADYLAQREQANAGLVLKKGMDRLVKLRAGYPTNSCPVVIGKNRSSDQTNVKLIAVA